MQTKHVGKVCIRANVAHQAGAYPGFCSMKRLGVFLLPPGWDASPSQGKNETCRHKQLQGTALLSCSIPRVVPFWCFFLAWVRL